MPTTVVSTPPAASRFAARARVLDGDRVDDGAAPVDVVDAEIVELDLQQHRGDFGRGVEVQRIGALQIRLGLGELGLGRALVHHAADFLLDQLQRLAGLVGAGLRARHEHRGVAEVQQIRIDAIGEPALFANLVIEARGERAAAEDVVDQIRGHEVRVLARDARAAEPDHRLRHVELRHDPPSDLARRRIGHAAKLARSGQGAEHAVEHLAERGGVDVADRRDLQVRAGEHAAAHRPSGRRPVMVGTEVERAVVRPRVGVTGEGRVPPGAAGDRARIGGLAAERRHDLLAHAGGGLGLEPRLRSAPAAGARSSCPAARSGA